MQAVAANTIAPVCIGEIRVSPALHLSALLFLQMKSTFQDLFSLAIPNAVRMLERISRPIIYMS